MKFDSTKSTSRNRPPNGTADLERSRVSGWSRSPLPPAMIIARTRARRGIALSPPRAGPCPTPARGRGSRSPRARAGAASSRRRGSAARPGRAPAPPPAAFGQGERRPRLHRRQRLAERRRRHGGAARHLAGDLLEPERALEPPVAEELGVVGRADDGRPGGAGRGERGRHELDEVAGLEAHLLRGERGVVGDLAAEVAGAVRDAPEAQPAGEVLLVELEVRVVPRIAVLAAPDLEGGLRVAEEGDRRPGAATRRDAIGRVG